MSTNELSCLLWISTATETLGKEELEVILEQARKRNADADITGLLVMGDGHFIQVLEGPELEIHETFSRIERDDRHANVLKLLHEPIQERFFPQWSMAFKDSGNYPEIENNGLLRKIIDSKEKGGTIEIVSSLFGVFNQTFVSDE